jgi:hypothetical protein
MKPSPDQGTYVPYLVRRKAYEADEDFFFFYRKCSVSVKSACKQLRVVSINCLMSRMLRHERAASIKSIYGKISESTTKCSSI